MADLIGIITAGDPGIRNQSLEKICAGLSVEELLAQGAALDTFCRGSDNLYERVRALFFLYSIHRFHLPPKIEAASRMSGAPHRMQASRLPFAGYQHLLQ